MRALMVEDDDTNYTTIGFAIVKKHGANFTQQDVAAFWCENVPIHHTCTAERVAYRNFAQCIVPPASATYRNPYREWIGAQIRGDVFGWVSPGAPRRAASLAFRDAIWSATGTGSAKCCSTWWTTPSNTTTPAGAWRSVCSAMENSRNWS